MSAELWKSAARVLDANWSGDHMVPSRQLYPHQCSWDSAFIAIGLAYVNPNRAWQDLRNLFETQWPDGRVPRIVCDPRTAQSEHSPGPGLCDVPACGGPALGSTGLVQPPLHALAVWEVYRRSASHGAPCVVRARSELAWLYPRLLAQQQYLIGARGAGGTGLASIVHPWESGLDDSPAFDAAMAAVPADAAMAAVPADAAMAAVPADAAMAAVAVDPAVSHGHRRGDFEVTGAAHQPTDADHARHLGPLSAYRDRGYADDDLARRHPFVVECPSFNSILASAEVALARIAEVVGADAAGHRARAQQITTAVLDTLWEPRTRTFRARDVRTGRLSPARCINGLVPLILPGLPTEHAAAIMAEAHSPRFGLPGLTGLPVPSHDRTAADFDRLRSWRGPIWINVNWLLRRGMLAHGFHGEAESLRGAMLRLVHRSGHFECYHPETGDGIGAARFSWTAALALDLLADRSVPAYAHAA